MCCWCRCCWWWRCWFVSTCCCIVRLCATNGLYKEMIFLRSIIESARLERSIKFRQMYDWLASLPTSSTASAQMRSHVESSEAGIMIGHRFEPIKYICPKLIQNGSIPKRDRVFRLFSWFFNQNLVTNHTPRVSCYCYYCYSHWHFAEEAAAVALMLWYCYSLL